MRHGWPGLSAAKVFAMSTLVLEDLTDEGELDPGADAGHADVCAIALFPGGGGQVTEAEPADTTQRQDQ
jgi:hypothetical protein